MNPGFDAVDGSSTRRVSAIDMGATKAPMIRRSYYANSYDNWSDIAKSVFQVHGVDAVPRDLCGASPAQVKE